MADDVTERLMQVNSVLLIHGAGGGGWEWTPWSRVFAAAGWRVLAPDLMPVADGLAATRFSDYLGQVCAWCRELRPDLVVGASLGGLLAQCAHDACSQAGLVLVNPMPPATAEARPRYPPIVHWQRDASLRSTADALPDADASTWHHAWSRWRDESGAVLNEAGIADVCLPSPSRYLVIVSAADTDVAPATSRALADELGADLIDLAGASHVGPLLGRDAAAVAERVLAWWSWRS